MSWTPEEIQSALKQVQERAQDPEFRKLCVTDAGAAIKAVTGKELPSNFTIQFVDQQAAAATIILPDLVSDELSEQDLEQVAGGSKSGATNFFEGLGSGLTGGLVGSVNGDEGTAGSIIGTVIKIGATA